MRIHSTRTALAAAITLSLGLRRIEARLRARQER